MSAEQPLTACQPVSENTGWCYNLYLEPSKPCWDKAFEGAQTGRITIWPQALSPKNTALKTSESYRGLRIECKCSHVPREPKTAIFTAYWGLGPVPETINQVACPDTSKEELVLINPVPHFLQRSLNLEVYDTTRVSHRAGASGISTGQRERERKKKGSHICCLG